MNKLPTRDQSTLLDFSYLHKLDQHPICSETSLFIFTSCFALNIFCQFYWQNIYSSFLSRLLLQSRINQDTYQTSMHKNGFISSALNCSSIVSSSEMKFSRPLKIRNVFPSLPVVYSITSICICRSNVKAKAWTFIINFPGSFQFDE